MLHRSWHDIVHFHEIECECHQYPNLLTILLFIILAPLIRCISLTCYTKLLIIHKLLTAKYLISQSADKYPWKAVPLSVITLYITNINAFKQLKDAVLGHCSLIESPSFHQNLPRRPSPSLHLSSFVNNYNNYMNFSFQCQ